MVYQHNTKTTEDRDRILLVDDAPSSLALNRARLSRHFDVDLAISAASALEMIQNEPRPYQVIVTDQVMPDMDGLALLRQVKRIAPKTIRILLTGAADLDLASRAVNEGQVYRFLEKEGPTDGLVPSVAAGVREYHRRVAQAEMMEQVLGASVGLLLEVLAAVNPDMAKRCFAWRSIATRMAIQTEAAEPMEVSLAVILASVGRLTISQKTLQEIGEGTVSLDGRADLERAQNMVSGLLASVPKLNAVSEMVGQSVRLESASSAGSQILWASERLLDRRDGDMVWLDKRQDQMREDVFTVAKRMGAAKVDATTVMKPVRYSCANLRPGDILDEDIHGRDDKLILARGQPLTMNMIERLRFVLSTSDRKQPISVLRAQ